MSRLPGPERYDPASPLTPARTPGTLGINDAADPGAHARLGDTPGSLGINDGAARLCSPAMPRAKLDPPEMAVVRATRALLESAKRECSVKADTAATYWKAWEDSRKRLGHGGDPALRRTAETEVELWKRQVDSLVKPATLAYVEAIAGAVKAGCVSLSGNFSAEEVMKRLVDIECMDQELYGENEPIFIGPGQWLDVLNRLAEYCLRVCRSGQKEDKRGFKLAIMILSWTEVVESRLYDRIPQRFHEEVAGELQRQYYALRNLREFIEEMFRADTEAREATGQ
jgi:hypothetical protein